MLPIVSNFSTCSEHDQSKFTHHRPRTIEEGKEDKHIEENYEVDIFSHQRSSEKQQTLTNDISNFGFLRTSNTTLPQCPTKNQGY